MEKRTFYLNGEGRQSAADFCLIAPEGMKVTFAPPGRSLDQNALLWALLNDISKQVIWHGRKLDSESWKHIFSSSLKKQEVVPNLDGTGFVVLGQSTSKMTKTEFSELIELIQAFAAQNGVNCD